MQQTSFFKTKLRRDHGGSLSIGKRRSYRPLNCKQPLHVTLRSQHAKGTRSLLRHRAMIVHTLRKWEKRFSVRVYEYSINGNHLHLLIRGKSRAQLQNFFRVVAGHIAQNILREFPLRKPAGPATDAGTAPRPDPTAAGGAPGDIANASGSEKEKAKLKLGCKKNRRVFWDLLLYSRILTWGRKFQNVRRYIVQNILESLNLIAYKPRSRKRPRKMAADPPCRR